MGSGTRLNFGLFTQPYSAEVDDMTLLLMPQWTTAQFADPTHRVNIEDKYLGRLGWDSTLGAPRVATGAAAADSWDLLADVMRQPSATTAELADVGDAINTDNKYAGKIVWNSDTSTLVYAVSSAAGGAWNGVHDQILDHTPS